MNKKEHFHPQVEDRVELNHIAQTQTQTQVGWTTISITLIIYLIIKLNNK